MGFGFSINYDNTDTQTFANYMNAALTDPTYQGNLTVKALNIPISADLASSFYFQPEVIKPLDGNDIRFSYSSLPYEFGLANSAALMDPTLWSSGVLNNYDIGLSAYNNAYFMEGYSKLNPFRDAMSDGLIKFKPGKSNDIVSDVNKLINALGAASKGSVAGGNNGSIVVGGGDNGAVINPKDTSDKGKFNNAVAIIKAYGEKAGKSYDDQIDKITKDMNGNYKVGLEALKKIVNTFDKNTLYEVLKDIHHQDYKNRMDSAKTISNSWANKIGDSTDGNFAVDTSGLTVDNVLNVLGSYISNPKFQNGGMWNNLINNNYDKISKTLLQKADRCLAHNDINPAEKSAITSAKEKLSKAQTDKEKSDCAYELFSALRHFASGNNDVGIYGIYAPFVPADKRVDKAELYERKEFEKEQAAYKSAPKMTAQG